MTADCGSLEEVDVEVWFGAFEPSRHGGASAYCCPNPDPRSTRNERQQEVDCGLPDLPGLRCPCFVKWRLQIGGEDRIRPLHLC